MEQPMSGDTATLNESRDSGLRANTAPNSSQVIFYGISEKALFLLVLFVLGVALVVAILALDRATGAAATATAEVAALRETVRTNNAKYEVLQYDHNALKQQLVAKGMYQPTEH